MKLAAEVRANAPGDRPAWYRHLFFPSRSTGTCRRLHPLKTAASAGFRSTVASATTLSVGAAGADLPNLQMAPNTDTTVSGTVLL